MLSDKQFIVDPEIKKTGLTGIFISFENIKNKDADDDFEKLKRKVMLKAYQYTRHVGDLKHDCILQGFRQLHEAVGASNRTNLSAPENLFKHLSKNRNLPKINLLVDIYNLISVNYKLALGAHDWSKIEGNIHLRFTDGSEKFIPLGETEPKQIDVGYYSYVDDNKDIICHLDVRQCDKTKVTLETKNIFVVVQGNGNTPFPYIEDAASELILLVKKYCGGNATVIGQIEDIFYDYQI